VTSQPAGQQPAQQRGLLVIYLALMLAILLAALDQTIVATALPTIVSDLGGLSHLSWVVTAYILASTATTQVWGKLGDQYGRKYLFIAAIIIFLVGSALSGLASSMTELIAFRALQGIGGGGLMVLAQAIVGDIVPPRERGKYLLITSIASGQLIARTGRYRIYPIIGTALLVVALLLLSRLDEHTSTGQLSLDFFVLGFALGLILQVLVIAVQNSADFQDLGAATSGVTFFRSIGGSFGVSVFGAIFSNRLATELAAALREVPLRATSSVGIGEGLGAAPPERSSVDEVERSLARLASADIRRRGYERLAALAGLDLPAGSCWILTRLAKQGSTGPVRSEDLARQANVTMDYGKPFVDRLVAEGMVVRSDGTLVLTDAGRAAPERLFAARREALRELLADWSPEEYAELGELLTKLSRALLGADADRKLISSTTRES
jgi:DNA-binding MarR family transcriptional regulator